MTALMLYHDTYACTGPAGADAPELVLLHGWGLHALVWDPVVPALLERFQVTVIDLPGMGRSPLPAGEYDLDYVLRLLLAVAPARAVWMGWSLGGTLATMLAARHPERVTGLVLVASNPRFTQQPDWPTAMSPRAFAGFRDLFDEDRDGTLIRFLSLQCQGSVRQREDIRFLQEILHHQGLPAPEALQAGLHLLDRLDARAALAGLRCPLLALFGAQDVLVPAAVVPALQSLQPTLETVVIAGSGHVPFLAQPAAFQQAVDAFITRHALA